VATLKIQRRCFQTSAYVSFSAYSAQRSNEVTGDHAGAINQPLLPYQKNTASAFHRAIVKFAKLEQIGTLWHTLRQKICPEKRLARSELTKSPRFLVLVGHSEWWCSLRHSAECRR
jgi:hypothetical protein